MTNSPAGWYPQEDGRQRYWDGAQWTEHFAPGATPAAASVSSAVQQGDAVPSPKPWFKKKRLMIPAGLVGGVIFVSALGSALGDDGPQQDSALTASTSSSSSASPRSSEAPAATASPTAESVVETTSPSPTPTPSKAAPKPKPKPAAPSLTLAQENAKGTAESYLDMSGFSKKSLMEQLKFEGYKKSDIEAAMATMKVDWNAEAVESAQSYLDMTNFSRSGLIEQLEFEGYTSKQANYAVKKVGL
ncbi:Ltp family lipoprotein [Phycicoccus jejuensis]|uniref:Ltp family lipoprotein n=1 Tax=Phycicoccus jejuensis TaxID=367299 RepID=UPI00068B6884|nr:Ltp family lipoprotein [Phycicoccus jejuensis]